MEKRQELHKLASNAVIIAQNEVPKLKLKE